MPKILFIAAHRPDRSPSQRYRFEQYFDFLRSRGYECKLSWLISERDDALFYSSGIGPQKLYVFLKSLMRRLRDLMRASDYDIVFVQREAFMTGSVFFEKRFSRSGAFLIYDFDDAIWHLDVSDANRRLGWLKRPGKTADIIAMADVIIAGNNYLCSYAKQYNPHVRLIPTTIDTDRFRRKTAKVNSGPVCIGWSGSLTTIKHFEHAISFLKKLKDKYGSRISFKVMGDDTYENVELGVKGIAWSNETEVEELASFDIGIMPLPDDEWVKGKCGLKGLSYMSLEVPTVMSDVGVNRQIIRDGENGFLASSDEEWLKKISLLIESEELRRKMGQEGRKTVVERYSVLSQRETYLEVFEELIKSRIPSKGR
jgi:glycosyltransferase involved in cell wall biosynthesis